MDPLILLFAILSTFIAFGALLLVCDLSERMSAEFISVGYMADQFSWYSFTYEMQRMLPTIFIHVNEPVNFKSFGGTTCSRSTYKSVSIIQNFTRNQFLSIFSSF